MHSLVFLVCVACHTIFFTWAQDSTVMVDYLIVGGGGVGTEKGGGGGGGGFVEGTMQVPLRGAAMAIEVGMGGNSITRNGGNSMFHSIIAYGGGAGSNTVDGADGGCGGGGSAWGEGGTGSQGGNGMNGHNIRHDKYRSGGGRLGR